MCVYHIDLFACYVQFPVYFQIRDFFSFHIRMIKIDRNKYSININPSNSFLDFIIIPLQYSIQATPLFFFFFFKRRQSSCKKYSKSILPSFFSLSCIFLDNDSAHNSSETGFFFLHRFFQGLSFHLVQIFYNTFYLYRKINLKILSNNFFDIKKKKYLRERKSSTLKFSVFSSRANICVWNIFFFTTREQWNDKV